MHTKYKILLFSFSLIISFACGIIWGNLTSKLHFSLNSSMTYSINAIREKSSTMGIWLPRQAWNVDFHWKGNGPDSCCYIAFSASKKDIEETIEKLKATTPQGHSEFSIPAPINDEGQALAWWPSNTLNAFNVQKGTFYWSGYDSQNSRVYIYKFTQ